MDRINREYLSENENYFGNGHRLPDELYEKRIEVFNKIAKLNKRGIDNAIE